MIVRNKIFVWIPKTGGTSLYSLFKEEWNMQLFTENYHLFKNDSSVTFGHANIKDLIEAKILKLDFYKDCDVFAFIRNPYDRFISLYRDFLRSGRIYPKTTLEKFAHALLHNSRKIGMYNVIDYSQCANQVDWLIDPYMEIYLLSNAKDDIKYELKIEKELPHLNKSGDDDYFKYYNNEILKMVNDLYYKDFTILSNYKMYDHI